MGPVTTVKFLDGANGWHGWQWLFLVQGLPASVLGVVAFLFLQDSPAEAKWLSADEKRRLGDHLANDVSGVASASHSGMGALLRDPKVYALALVYFLLLGATYTMVFWLPTLIKALGVTDLLQIGLYAAIPNAVGVVGMILIGRSSDRLKERRWHFAACVALAAIGLYFTTLVQGNMVPTMLALTCASVGIASATPLFFTITTEYLSKASAAVGIALISSLGNLGAAVSPSVTGLITARTGSPVYSMHLVVALYVVTGLLLLWVVRPRRASPTTRIAGAAA